METLIEWKETEKEYPKDSVEVLIIHEGQLKIAEWWCKNIAIPHWMTSTGSIYEPIKYWAEKPTFEGV